jgi:hypothetical protein
MGPLEAPSRWSLPGLAGLIGVAVVLGGCGGGAPLLHPAYVLPPGEIMIGAGVSGEFALARLPADKLPADQQNRGTLQNLTVSPSVAPWAGGRVGIIGSNEGGLTYTGRAIRLDARHAFMLGKAALSIGLGASGLFPLQPSGGNAHGVWGGGADLPILIGIRSSSDIVSFWFGPRGGFEILTGQVQLSDFAGNTPLFDVDGKHFYAGLVAGIRVGFRHVHLALELDGAYHAADGSFRPTSPAAGVGTTPAPSSSSSVQQLALTPAGALEVTF